MLQSFKSLAANGQAPKWSLSSRLFTAGAADSQALKAMFTQAVKDESFSLVLSGRPGEQKLQAYRLSDDARDEHYRQVDRYRSTLQEVADDPTRAKTADVVEEEIEDSMWVQARSPLTYEDLIAQDILSSQTTFAQYREMLSTIPGRSRESTTEEEGLGRGAWRC